MAGAIILAFFTLQQCGVHLDAAPVFATPVTETYARQVRLIAGALRASKTLPPSPLMTEKRETMVTAFKRAGYRTIALMPGLRQVWPEGAFYGFDDIYGASRLDYRGPEFGWFAVPDQFTLARFDAVERRNPAGAPRFVFLPTISTHFPFIPAPPYQPDWARICDDHPYDGPPDGHRCLHPPV